MGENQECPGVGSPGCELEYFNNYIQECWKNRQYYKDEQSKLMYWMGGVFAALVGASGVFGAVTTTNSIVAFTFWHTIIFHTLFVILWYFLLYKQLNADMYEQIGLTGERTLQDVYGGEEIAQLPPLFQIKGHYVGAHSSVTCGRHLTKIANLLIVALYFIVVTTPIWKGSFNAQSLTLDWQSVAATVFFVALVFYGQVLYGAQRKKMTAQIQADWQTVALSLERNGCA